MTTPVSPPLGDLEGLTAYLAAKYTDEYAWQDKALCAQADPEAWFPERGQPSSPAKKVCMACPVRVDCLEGALEHDERFGVWGGMSERQRRRLKRQRAAATTAGSEVAA